LRHSSIYTLPWLLLNLRIASTELYRQFLLGF
jgi:hypothetical protein